MRITLLVEKYTPAGTVYEIELENYKAEKVEYSAPEFITVKAKQVGNTAKVIVTVNAFTQSETFVDITVHGKPIMPILPVALAISIGVIALIGLALLAKIKR